MTGKPGAACSNCLDELSITKMLGLALFVGDRWSGNPDGRRHGCVLAYQGRYVVGTGYNGRVARDPQPFCACADKPKEWCLQNCEAVHAEENALANAARVGARVEQCAAYVTKEPCGRCMRLLTNAGVSSVYFIAEPKESMRRVIHWSPSTGSGHALELKKDPGPCVMATAG